MNDHCHGIISLNEISKYNPVFHLSICKRDSEIINILKKPVFAFKKMGFAFNSKLREISKIHYYERFIKFKVTRDLKKFKVTRDL